MDNLNDLKEIWRTANTDGLPGSSEMARFVKKYRNQRLLKIAVLVISAIVLTAGMVAVVFVYKSTMLTTRIGEVCIILSGVILTATNLNSLNRFYGLSDLSNKEFIEFLEHTRVRQNFYHKKTQVAGLALCSAGLLLYLYEPVYQDITAFIIVYAIAIIFLLITWLVIRPRAFKKQSLKMNETIKKIETLSKQL